MRLEHPERSPRPSEEKPEEGTWPPNVPKQPSSCAASQRNCAEAPLSHHACLGTAFTRATQGSPSLSTQGRQGLWVLPAPFGGRSMGRNVGCLGASRLQVHTSHQNNPPAPSPPPCTPMKKRGHRPTEREGYCSWHLMGSICCIPLGCCPGWIGKELAGRLSSVLTTWLGGSRGAWQGQSTGPGNCGLVHVCMHVCVCICMHMCVLGGGEEAEKPHPLLVAAVLLRASAARGCHYTSWQVSASKTVLGSSPSWLSWRWESQLSPVASRVGPCCGIGWPVLLPPP